MGHNSKIACDYCEVQKKWFTVHKDMVLTKLKKRRYGSNRTLQKKKVIKKLNLD
jgi:bisphosphoglycerate-dependent phosphoglycerate mutase